MYSRASGSCVTGYYVIYAWGNFAVILLAPITINEKKIEITITLYESDSDTNGADNTNVMLQTK